MGMDRAWYVCQACIPDDVTDDGERTHMQCEFHIYRETQKEYEPDDSCTVNPGKCKARWMFGGYD